MPAVARAAAPVIKTFLSSGHLNSEYSVGHLTGTRRTGVQILVVFRRGGWLHKRFLGL